MIQEHSLLQLPEIFVVPSLVSHFIEVHGMPVLLIRSVSFHVCPVFCQCRRAELVTKRTRSRPSAAALSPALVPALVFPNVAFRVRGGQQTCPWGGVLGGTWHQTLKLNATDSECTTRVVLYLHLLMLSNEHGPVHPPVRAWFVRPLLTAPAAYLQYGAWMYTADSSLR